MSTTLATPTKVAVGQSTATLSIAAATGGTAPYSYQWYQSVSSGFVPGAGSLVAGATSLSPSFSGLQPAVNYYYKVVAIDASASTGSSAQLGIVTAPAQNQNQFAQSPVLGMLDQAFNFNTKSMQVDAAQATPLLCGQAVKMASTAGGVPKVLACAANSDDCIGFINYNQKNQYFSAGDAVEISQVGNVIYLISVGAITRGAQVQLDLTYVGGVKTKTGASGADIVGQAYDAASGDGQLMRVVLSTPSFTKA